MNEKNSEIQMFQVQGDAYFRTDLKRLAHKILMLKTTFTLLRIGLKTAQKSNKTAFRLHSTGADLFENVTFAVATRPRFLNVVEQKRSATRRSVNTNAVTFWYHL